METPEICKQCEKFELHVQTKTPIVGPLTIPNTYSKTIKKYIWKHTDMMGYALIPRSVEGMSASVDMFLCIDEDLLNDVDVYGYATKFINNEILPQWTNIKEFTVVGPELRSPEALPCWKVQHQRIIEKYNNESVIPE